MRETLSTDPQPTNRYQLTLDEHEPRWFAVYTRFRREKQVNKRLSDIGIDVYLPLQHVTRHYTRKVKHVQLPLISCYIFTRITKKDYLPILQDPDVVRFVRLDKELVAIPEQEMSLMRRIVGENIEVTAEPGAYHVGDPVEIIGGNLTGISGILVEKDGRRDFVVELESIGQSLRMAIDPKYLRKLEVGSRK